MTAFQFKSSMTPFQFKSSMTAFQFKSSMTPFQFKSSMTPLRLVTDAFNHDKEKVRFNQTVQMTISKYSMVQSMAALVRKALQSKEDTPNSYWSIWVPLIQNCVALSVNTTAAQAKQNQYIHLMHMPDRVTFGACDDNSEKWPWDNNHESLYGLHTCAVAKVKMKWSHFQTNRQFFYLKDVLILYFYTKFC
jgi:hypothetical protein